MKNLLEPLFYLMLYIKANTYSGVKFLLEVLQCKRHRIQTYSIGKKKNKTKPDDLSNEMTCSSLFNQIEWYQ